MKKSLLLAVGLLAGLTFLLLREPPPAVEPERIVETPVPAPPPVEYPAPLPAMVNTPAPVESVNADAPASPVFGAIPVWTPQSAVPLDPGPALESLRMVFRNYGQRFKGNPVGNNQEITAALAGENPAGVHFLDPERDRINDRGELVDGWGTPYFFHQLSGTEMEIHSAGPDCERGTADDVVIR
jgi:hypothetical protein